ncbi:MAG: Sodium/calcium exchanger protein-domain-containing protein [Linnemannia gamsii]|nr:MAG: Sodium/calcium exchanger protein-domain-containing protein [Linnemannia gamsii]
MALAARSFYLVLTIFLFSQVVTVLWPQRYLSQSSKGNKFGLLANTQWFSKRSLLDDPLPDVNQCEDIWKAPDRCAFVRENCDDYPAGLINYLHFYFCDLSHVPAAATMLLCAWLIFLFGFVGVAASDFFCPNLSTIAKKLHLSESMTGVTFLAFGNGSPDVFSTFSAMGAGSGSLAIGELVGAASFITSVVVGSMAIIKPFKVSRAPFLRDVIFFAGCVLFTLYTVIDGKITFVESVTLVAYYIFYVAFVVIGNWRHQKLKAERELEERARNLYEDDDNDIDDDGLGPDEEQALLSRGSQRGPKPPRINTLIHTGPYDAYEDDEHDDGEGAEDSISLRPHGAPAFKRRPSLVAAFEFSDVVRSLSLSGSRPRLQSFDPSYYGTKSPRSPRVSRRGSSRSSRPMSVHTPQDQDDSRPTTPLSHHSTTPNDHAAHAFLGAELGDHNLTTSPHALDSETNSVFEQAMLRHSIILPDHHDPAHYHLGHVHHQGSPEDSPGLQGTSTRSQRFKEYLQAIHPIYFPTLLNWDEKSLFVKFLAITSLPMVLLLTLTLPVVELCDEEEDESQNVSPVDTTGQDARRLPKIVIGDKKDEEVRYDGWSRTATTVQMVLAPVFVASVISSAAQEGYISIAVALAVGIALSFLVHRFSTEETPPRFYGAFCFAGFLVAITWIFLVANEVVGILQAFGMIFGVSDAILGLTIFAMGNSLGDLVANITIARMGFPRMAFSACFGGPLLNMLLGVGISGTYMTLNTGNPIPLELSPTLFVSIIGVLVTLLTAIVVVPRNGYVMSRTWGYFLLAMYTTCTIINVVIEIKHGKKSM